MIWVEIVVGLLAALRLSGADDLRDEVAELLRAAGLPTTMDDVDPDAALLHSNKAACHMMHKK